MTRDNLLFAIIGLLFGFIVGFIFASTTMQREAANGSISRTQQIPADHPPIGADGTGAPQQAPGQMQASVLAALDKARKEPNNFDAQKQAAALYLQIQRFDQAIDYLIKANQLKPDDFEIVATLGEANMDAGHYEAAERWYKAALVKQPDNIPVLDGYCFVLLKQGNAKAAEEAIAKLAKIDPNNQDLSQFRQTLAGLK
jgi:tetratricopeptide (TPR) repeat protein